MQRPRQADFRVETLSVPVHKFGPAGITNTEQGSQSTFFAWTDRLQRIRTRIPMDEKGRCLDNTFIERFWRALTSECVDLHAWET